MHGILFNEKMLEEKENEKYIGKCMMQSFLQNDGRREHQVTHHSSRVNCHTTINFSFAVSMLCLNVIL